MNYGKKGIRRKQKELRSQAARWGNKFSIFALELILVGIIGVGVIGIAVGIGAFKGILASAPPLNIKNVSPSGYSTFVYDIEGRQTAKLVSTDANRIPVTMEQIPENLAHAFVAIEDSRFYEHNGIDIQSIIRIFYVGIKSKFKDMQGASTITQQLIKNSILSATWTSENSKIDTIKRKFQEQYLAIELEKVMDKDTILETYLNTINLGQNTLGVQAASLRYFNKPVSNLNLSECAVIAAITQNPSKYNPISRPEKNAERREKVLRDMRDQGYISEVQYEDALADDVYSRIQTVNNEVEDDTINSYFVDALVDDVLRDLVDAGYTENQAYALLYSGGLKIYSTQDPHIQSICDSVFTNEDNFPDNTKWELSYELTVQKANGEMENYSSEKMRKWFQENISTKHKMIYSSTEDAYQDIETFKSAVIGEGDEEYGEKVTLTPQPQVSLTVEDQKTGHVVAMVGGRGTKEASRTLNRASGTTRQPGSTFKVVSTYAPALDSAGLTLATVHMDEPFNYVNGRPVSNWYSSGYRGICSMRDGIRDSLNIITVKFLTQITPQLGFDYLTNFGFTTLESSKIINGEVFSDIQQSLALGGITNGVTNKELTAAYASIANGGIYNEPVLYTKITDHDGNVILDQSEIQESRRVIKETTSFLLTSAMQDVVTSGTGGAVNFGGMSIAGKTGTTSDNNDVWFSGYTPYYTATTWAGYDNQISTSKLKGSGETALAKKLWRAVMSEIHAELPNESFPMPSGIVTATVCSKSGKLPVSGLCDGTLKTEYFAEGTVPTDSCNVHYGGTMCAYDNLPASPECPFKYNSVLTLNPDTLTTMDPALEGEEPVEQPIQDPGVTCEHNAVFFATPGYEQILALQQAQLIAAGLFVPAVPPDPNAPPVTPTVPPAVPEGTTVTP